MPPLLVKVWAVLSLGVFWLGTLALRDLRPEARQRPFRPWSAMVPRTRDDFQTARAWRLWQWRRVLLALWGAAAAAWVFYF